jgi:hypothetical protein
MNNRALLSQAEPQDQDAWAHRALGDQNYRQDTPLLAWWYQLTAPSDPPPGVTFEQHDRVRRGRIASALMLFLAATLILAGLVAAFGPNKQIFNIIIPVLLVIVISIPLNRRGHVNWAGFLLAGGLAGSMSWSLLTAPGGLSPTDTQILFLLMFADLFFVAILPLKWGFLPGLINMALSVCVLSFARHSPALTTMLPVSYFPTIFRLAQVHIVATGVPMILVGIMRQLIQRADTAVEVAKLEHKLKAMLSEQLQDKKELDACIELIVTVCMRFSNGDWNVRVPLEQAKPLLTIAGPLNSLLGRYLRAKHAEEQWNRFSPYLPQWQEIERIHLRMQNLSPLVLEAMQQAVQEQRPFSYEKTFTPLDTIIQELNGKYILPAQSHALTSR